MGWGGAREGAGRKKAEVPKKNTHYNQNPFFSGITSYLDTIIIVSFFTYLCRNPVQ